MCELTGQKGKCNQRWVGKLTVEQEKHKTEDIKV